MPKATSNQVTPAALAPESSIGQNRFWIRVHFRHNGPQKSHRSVPAIADLFLTGATPNPLSRQRRLRQPLAGDLTKTTSGKVGVLEDIIKTIIDAACC